MYIGMGQTKKQSYDKVLSMKKSLNNDEAQIDSLLKRGVESIYPSADFLRSKLLGPKKLKIYLGIDPTGPTLHLGHVIPLMKLREFQNLGHEIILLMGDFTAMIGDPTDKTATRKQLTHKEVLLNLKNYKKQASLILKFTGKNPAKILFNSKWLAKMNFAELLNIASKITYAQLIKRDMFQARILKGEDIHFHELMYPIMQGYDSVAMKVDGEIGGNDQTFNMLVGRDLEKKILNKEKFVISTKLLVDPTGKKMGKSEGNMLTLKDSPENMYGKIMSWNDSMIIPGLELCTNLPMEKINFLKNELSSGVNPKNIKSELAWAVVEFFHGGNKANKAKESFANTFQKKEAPSDPTIIRGSGYLGALLVNAGILASTSEFRRLISGGGVKDITNDQKIIDQKTLATTGSIYKIGKHRFVKVIN
jgi:tyrosyl-tRNA synthetase